MTKSTHCGQAAALGLEAAMLAARGFTANPDTFEAKQGYVDTFHDAFDARELLNFGRAPWRIVSPGYAIKMFPSQYGTHFGITAALELHGRIKGKRVRSVRLTTPVMRYVDRPRPASGLDGKFSLQYTAAAALLDGHVGIRTFTDARLGRADMQDLLARFEVVQDPALSGRFEDMHVVLEVMLADGTVERARCNGPRGKWGTPPISEAEHMVKVSDCLATRLAPPAAKEIVGLLANIDELDAAGLRQLMDAAGFFTAH
jgi:aconitate decarboxylase